MVEVRQSQPTDEILLRNGKLFREKIMSSLEEMLAVSRYTRDETLSELGLGTEVFVTLVRALANKDIYLCVALLKVAETVSPLLTAQQYMAYQMLEMFQISPCVIQEAVQYLKKLEECRLFNIPGSIGAMLRHASDIVVAGQSANTIPSNKCLSATSEIRKEQVERSQTEPNEAIKVSSEREEAMNDRGPARGLPYPQDILEMISLFFEGGRCKSEEGDSPLHTCVRNKNVDLVKVLLGSGNDVNAKNSNHKTCLMVAVNIRHLEIVDLLLQNGADPNIPDNNSDTPLFAAAITGDLEIIRKLVDKGADIDHKNSKGFSVLYQAVRESKRESAILLKELGANLCPTDVINAAKYCDLRVLELLKELGADLNVRNSLGQTPLHLAVGRKNEPFVRYLLEAGADPNTPADTWRRTPLHWAVESKSEPLVKCLLEAGATPNAPVDTWGRTPIHLAVNGDDDILVRYLLEAGGDPNVKDSWGQTPLHLAVSSNNQPLVSYLIKAGADQNAKDAWGRTPLSVPVSSRRRGAKK